MELWLQGCFLRGALSWRRFASAGSPAFGQILQARAPRLLQLAVKVVF
jgi:hypothetical protein